MRRACRVHNTSPVSCPSPHTLASQAVLLLHVLRPGPRGGGVPAAGRPGHAIPPRGLPGGRHRRRLPARLLLRLRLARPVRGQHAIPERALVLQVRARKTAGLLGPRAACRELARRVSRRWKSSTVRSYATCSRISSHISTHHRTLQKRDAASLARILSFMGVRRPARLELLIDGGFALTFVLTRVVGCVTESPAIASQPDTLSTPPHHAASYGLGFTHSLRGLWLGYYAPLPATQPAAGRRRWSWWPRVSGSFACCSVRHRAGGRARARLGTRPVAPDVVCGARPCWHMHAQLGPRRHAGAAAQTLQPTQATPPGLRTRRRLQSAGGASDGDQHPRA